MKKACNLHMIGEDHILPYCSSSKHVEDALFIVCEEDWRLRPEDDVAVPAFSRRREKMVRSPSPDVKGKKGKGKGSTKGEPFALLLFPQMQHFCPATLSSIGGWASLKLLGRCLTLN